MNHSSTPNNQDKLALTMQPSSPSTPDWTKDITHAAQALRSKTISSVELTQHYIDKIKQSNDLGAFLYTDFASALKQAAAADTLRMRGENTGPLCGIPIALKDNFLTENIPTTCGSKILEGFIAPYDGTAVKRLKEAHTVCLGKLNMDEFAMGSSNEHSAYHVVKNPWDFKRVPGGSSGGSAAAVAAGLTLGALGTDTGGSIRQPAAFTGTVGLKPTYGRVSRYGVIAFASSLDQVGPITKTVADNALLLQTISGQDLQDATSSARHSPQYYQRLGQDSKGITDLVIGIPKEFFEDGLAPEVATSVQAALQWFSAQGATLKEISLPHLPHAIATYYLICTAEASSNLSRYDGVRYGKRSSHNNTLTKMYERTRGEGFGLEVKRRIMLGTFALSSGYYDAYYEKAQRVRTLIAQDFESAYQHVDLILGPTTPNVAFHHGTHNSDPLAMYLADIYTVPANLAGLPALSLPCGFNSKKLPIGLQMIAPHWHEQQLLNAAYWYEQAHDYYQQIPDYSR